MTLGKWRGCVLARAREARRCVQASQPTLVALVVPRPETQVLDFLVSTSRLLERGFSAQLVRQALEIFGEDEQKGVFSKRACCEKMWK